MALYSYKYVRARAEELIKRFGLTEPPIDIRSIAEQLEIQVIEMTLPLWFSGALIRLDDNYHIVLNRNLTSTQKMLTIAHEIAHHQMDHHEICYMKNKQRPFSHLEADIFAEELCMPGALVKREAEKWHKDHRFLARLFGVDEEAMIKRLEELELIPRGRYVWEKIYD